MSESTEILIVDADSRVARAMAATLQKAGLSADARSDVARVLSELDQLENKVRLLILEADLTGRSCDELLSDLRQQHPDVAAIVTTSFGRVEAAVHAMQSGAEDYLVKPITEAKMIASVHRALARQKLVEGLHDLSPDQGSEAEKTSRQKSHSNVAENQDSTETPLQVDEQPHSLQQALLGPEKQIIRAAMDRNDWNRNAAARELKIDRTTLYKKLRKFKLDRPDDFA
jgi:DNA-binding NtrC family response regulator